MTEQTPTSTPALKDLLKEDIVQEPVVANEINEIADKLTTKPEEATVRVKQNVSVKYPFSEPTAWDEQAITVTLPSDLDTLVFSRFNNVPNVNLVDSPQARKWAGVLEEAQSFSTFNNAFVKTLEDPEAQFEQEVMVNNVPLRSRSPKYKAISGENLQGERAVMRIRSYIGLGSQFQAALWHTGIWLTFKAPTDTELLELNRIISADKIRLGRNTIGMVFSNTSSYTTDRLVDFALAHAYDSTLDTNKLGDKTLKDIILAQDIPSLIWGLVCSMYPKGFQYRRACVNDPVKCNHVEELLLHVEELQYTNIRALTEWQCIHMSNRQSSVKDLKSLERYYQESLKLQDSRIVLKGNTEQSLGFVLKSPTLQQYIESGQRWIGGITKMADTALGLDPNTNERNRYVTEQGKATAMRQYANWVKQIEMGTSVIDDLESVESVLSELSPDDALRNEFTESVVDYINKSTNTVIGIPAYDCPVCKIPQDMENNPYPNHQNIIPLEVQQLFFELLKQKIERIRLR